MASLNNSQTLTARWIFPIDAPPLERGTITIRADKIIAIEPAGARQADIDLGNVAILPGFVNAHTHLDLTGARGQTPPTPDYTAWLKQVIAFRKSLDWDAQLEDIYTGLIENAAAGTTLIGDISGTGWSLFVMLHGEPRG